jgi:enoyl-CoA hydratase
MTEHLLVELGAVTRITLNRPDKQNAMTAAMGRAIASAVDRINAATQPRVVLIEGAGRAFCAGGDFSLIEENSRRTPEDNRRAMLEFYGSYLSVLQLRTPTVAVLHGATVGAGLCLALACDLRLAATEAKLGANFVRVGLHPGMGATLLLPRVVGPARATELLLTGKLVDGAHAERIGLVHQAVARDQLRALVSETAEALASAAPIAVAQTKATLRESLLRDLPSALAREAAAQAIDFCTTDLREAVAAFRDGRRPKFAGT